MFGNYQRSSSLISISPHMIKHRTLGPHKNFIGGFPSQVFGLIKLRVLDLDKKLIKEIPSSGIVSPLSSSCLEELYLSYNKLTFIPNDFCQQLQHVKHLWLSNSKIASPLRSGLGKMAKLKELDLESIFFTGAIPSEMYSLANLRTLQLHGNILTGTFSSSVFANDKLDNFGFGYELYFGRTSYGNWIVWSAV